MRDGYEWEVVVEDLAFPTSVTFGDDGDVYIAEAGLPFGGAAGGGRVWRVGRDGRRVTVAEGLRAPVNGLTWHEGLLYVSEGGLPARLSRLRPDGRRETLLEGFPGPGNYHLNTTAVGPDGKLYFSQGAMTNLGIVGPDAYDVAWLAELPHAHDVPGFDLTLAGVNATTSDPSPAGGGDGEVVTGAFVPFGTRTTRGQRVPRGLPATASVMRCDLDGGGLELVAWGLRNAFGLGFLPDGRLLAVDQGADDRGSRAVGNAPDLLFEVRQGAWYGWPDYVGDVAVTDSRFAPERGPRPQFLLEHDELPPPQPALLEFPPHVAAVKFDLAPHTSALRGHLIVALFGDEVPMTAPRGPRVGRGLVAVDTASWRLRPLLSGDPLRRPIDVRVHGDEVYVLDFGQFEMTRQGVEAEPGSGRLWRLHLGSGSGGRG